MGLVLLYCFYYQREWVKIEDRTTDRNVYVSWKHHLSIGVSNYIYIYYILYVYIYMISLSDDYQEWIWTKMEAN